MDTSAEHITRKQEKHSLTMEQDTADSSAFPATGPALSLLRPSLTPSQSPSLAVITASPANEPWLKFVESYWVIQPKYRSVRVEPRRTVAAVLLPTSWDKKLRSFLRSKTGIVFSLLTSASNALIFLLAIAFTSPMWKEGPYDTAWSLLMTIPCFLVPYAQSILVSNADATRLVVQQFDSWFYLCQALFLAYGHCVAQGWTWRSLVLFVPLSLGSMSALLGDAAPARKYILFGFLMSCAADMTLLYFIQYHTWEPLKEATFNLYGLFRPVYLSSLMSSATVSVILFKLSFMHQAASLRKGRSRSFPCAVIKFPLQRVPHIPNTPEPNFMSRATRPVDDHKAIKNVILDGKGIVKVLPEAMAAGSKYKDASSEAKRPNYAVGSSSLKEQGNKIEYRGTRTLLSPEPNRSPIGDAVMSATSEPISKGAPEPQLSTKNLNGSPNRELPGGGASTRSINSHYGSSQDHKFGHKASQPVEKFLDAKAQPVYVKHRALMTRQPCRSNRIVDKGSQHHHGHSRLGSATSVSLTASSSPYFDLPKYFCMALFILGNALLWKCLILDLISDGERAEYASTSVTREGNSSFVSEELREDWSKSACPCELNSNYAVSFAIICVAVILLIATNANMQISGMLLRSFQGLYLSFSLAQVFFGVGYMMGLRPRLFVIFAMGAGFLGWVMMCDAIFLNPRQRYLVAFCVGVQLFSEIMVAFFLFSAISSDDYGDSRFHMFGTSLSMQSVAMDGLGVVIAYTAKALLTLLTSPEDFALLHSSVLFVTKLPSAENAQTSTTHQPRRDTNASSDPSQIATANK